MGEDLRLGEGLRLDEPDPDLLRDLDLLRGPDNQELRHTARCGHDRMSEEVVTVSHLPRTVAAADLVLSANNNRATDRNVCPANGMSR